MKQSFLKKLGSTGGVLTLLFFVFSSGFAVGRYYESVVSIKEITEIDNKHSNEMIDLKIKHSQELLESIENKENSSSEYEKKRNKR